MSSLRGPLIRQTLTGAHMSYGVLSLRLVLVKYVGVYRGWEGSRMI